MQIIKDYIYTDFLGIDSKKIRPSCYWMYEVVKANFSDSSKDFTAQSTLTTALYGKYNVLMYPAPGFHELYEGIQRTFRKVSGTTSPHYIQAWLNFYQKGDYIDWHMHWEPEFESWHGFYCVDCEPSKTSYKLDPSKDEIIDVVSENDKLILGPSSGDIHRTWPWEGDAPRITIAFDIVPASKIDPLENLNHWIPI
jgi:hypothetical protein